MPPVFMYICIQHLQCRVKHNARSVLCRVKMTRPVHTAPVVSGAKFYEFAAKSKIAVFIFITYIKIRYKGGYISL